jgi:hypothetical protein
MLILLAGALMLIVSLARVFRAKLAELVGKAKQGGAILQRPRRYLVQVVLPSFVGFAAKLGVIAVFLAAYGITVNFHTVMSVQGGNSIANTVSVTPGGVGVNQATNVAALGRRDRLSDGDCLLARPAAGNHGLEHRVRDRRRDLGFRLGGRQAAGGEVVRRRQGHRRAAARTAQAASSMSFGALTTS